MLARRLALLASLPVILVFGCAGSAQAQQVTRDADNFFILMGANTFYVQSVRRQGGTPFVTVTFRRVIGSQGRRTMDLPAVPGSPTDGTIVRNGVLCTGRMEVFQGALPAAAEQGASPPLNYSAQHYPWMVPTVFVARGTVGAILGFNGGTWLPRQITYQEKAITQYNGATDQFWVYPRPRHSLEFNLRATWGPFLDTPAPDNYRVFVPPTPSNIVLEDCPSVANVGSTSYLYGAPRQDVGAPSTLTYTKRYRTFFWHDCAVPLTGIPQTLFFRVDWGFRLTAHTFGPDVRTTLGFLQRDTVRIATEPPPPPASVGIIQDVRYWNRLSYQLPFPP